MDEISKSDQEWLDNNIEETPDKRIIKPMKSDYKYVAWKELNGWNITVRDDTREGLVGDIDWAKSVFVPFDNTVTPSFPVTTIAPVTEVQLQPTAFTPQPAQQAQNSKICSNCGAVLNYREGTNKNGKAYKGWFCSANCGASPQWVR